MTDMPQAMSVAHREARKQHKCCECRQAISVGETYVYVSGIWDEPCSFKQCLSCHEVSNKAALLAEREGGDPVCFRELRDFLANFIAKDFTGKEFLRGMAQDLGVEEWQIEKLVNAYE